MSSEYIHGWERQSLQGDGPTNWINVASTGKVGASHNRELLDVTTRESVTWAAADDTTQIVVVPHSPVGVVGAGDGIFVTFDAINDATADTWLTEAELGSTDSNRYFIAWDSAVTFSTTGPITRADVLLSGDSTCTAIHVIFEAN